MFEHYLSYGSTDQQTVRDLSGVFDGLLVPGTIAAFQAEGTKGFVLSLSARSAKPYIIDSRFPLFQNRLTSAKKSHAMLAEVLGQPGLIQTDRQPTPEDFTDEVVNEVAARWIDFNVGFDNVTTKTFDKYASRLQEAVFPENRQGPNAILPPYMMVESADDGWFEVSNRLWEASVQYATSRRVGIPLRRVLAATTADKWGALANSVNTIDIVAWVNDLEEFRPESVSELAAYARAIKSARERGQRVFALYGGFFSVLLARYGLVGSSHGIGFGEHRDYIELPSSGAPQARYYVPRLHKYISVELANVLWTQNRPLVACECEECDGASPLTLDYHSLMRHSVRVRGVEIGEWSTMPTSSAVARLREDFIAFREGVERLSAPTKIRKRAEDIYHHLAMWARILDEMP
ncbi:hypothetical protein [Clavibacter nebraskensis]|uniref:Uncharacterized protein n=2 Tax=Clavibacter nebraskensis TaxID=31963 RepID=A0AAI8ZKI5_9MICO|nr:hypothetical protein [Clavibacter nebraskensis]QKO03380.1 hypothetical protein EGX35_14835 [Clavibacter nebraskensis]QLL36503.1 hypothetical protein EGX36_14880 [Clavibacter nebraskensis]QLL36607.1 hypothetical protein EGX37_14835 [Clavibacter nebraskensis]UKF28656.1 hypothetical protein FGQ65_10900 [Clavibacter nebraskensis]UQB04825.1 hypothetical protein LIV34_002703 [Clavibacter nebraskensis]